MQQRFGLLNGGNAFLKISFVGIVNEKFYSFNKPKYAPTDAEIQLTTKKELLDLYFEYEGKRLVSTDRVPYNSKTPTKVKMVARTRNMIGEEIKFTAHALEDNSILENLGESKIKENGIAVLNFLKKAPTNLRKDGTETYYAGVEGFSTKHIKDKTLVFKVGAKWDTNNLETNQDLHKTLTIIGKTRLVTKKQLKKLENRINLHIGGIRKAIVDNKIDSKLKLAHFLSQIMHESGELRWTEEQNVSEDAYGGYKGRGLIRLTGETNYTNYGKFANEDVTSSLENKIKLEKNPHAANSAGWFWNKIAELNDDAERNDFIFITFVVNGGLNGYNERLNFLKNGFKALNISNSLDFKFKESKAFDNLKYSFGWGLWHDSTTSKNGCTKNNSSALFGYERFIALHDKQNKKAIKNNWYGYNRNNIRSFVESRIKELKNE